MEKLNHNRITNTVFRHMFASDEYSFERGVGLFRRGFKRKDEMFL